MPGSCLMFVPRILAKLLPTSMNLRATHEALDAAVEAAYGVDFGGDEEKIVAHLFGLYAQLTEGECLHD